MNWRRRLAWIKICLGRGQEYSSDFKNAVLLAIGLKVYGFTSVESIFLGCSCIFFFIFVGYLDLKYGIWKEQLEISTHDINPYFNRLERNLK